MEALFQQQRGFFVQYSTFNVQGTHFKYGNNRCTEYKRTEHIKGGGGKQIVYSEDAAEPRPGKTGGIVSEKNDRHAFTFEVCVFIISLYG
ncbi:MAG: hypothetical protein GY765_17825 [bacterium]|nr:hypothetical protein [bacterium]